MHRNGGSGKLTFNEILCANNNSKNTASKGAIIQRCAISYESNLSTTCSHLVTSLFRFFAQRNVFCTFDFASLVSITIATPQLPHSRH